MEVKAGQATALQVQRAGDPDPRPAHLAVVTAVIAGAPAECAGDIIRSLGPVPTPDAGTLLQALAAAGPGQRVEVTIVRAGQAAVAVTPGTLPAG